MSTEQDLMRKEFEVHAWKNSYFLVRDSVVDCYVAEVTETAWQAWQAARQQAVPIVMPPSPYMPDTEPGSMTAYEEGEAQGRCDMWAEVKRLNAAAPQAEQVVEPAGSYQKGYDEGRHQGTKHRVADIEQLRTERNELLGLCERLKQEAQIHAMEARTANATIAEIYQVVSGGKGEPGSWHGAVPVRACIGELLGLLREARELIEHGDFREGHCMCGSDVNRHTFGDGHSPVDAGAYYAGQVMERIDATLERHKC